MSLVNETIRHAAHTDAIAADSAAALTLAMQRKLFAVVERELKRRGDRLTRTDLAFIAGQIARQEPALREQARAIATTLLDAIASTTTAAFASGLRTSGVTLNREDGLAMAQTQATWIADNARYANKRWDQWADKLAVDALTQARRTIHGGWELGEPPSETLIELDTVRARAAAAADTLTVSLTTHVANGVRQKLASTRPEIAGCLFVSVLDLRTSAMCRGLSGNVYAKGRKDIPRPPLHPNCRSQLVPLTQAEFERYSGQQLQRSPPPTPDELNAAVDEGRTIKSVGEDRRTADLLIQMGKGPDASIPSFKVSGYDEWLSDQPEDVQRELLGRTRWQAWKDGVPLSSLATSRKRLTLEQLRALYPGDFVGA